jgi:hypothetical protein
VPLLYPLPNTWRVHQEGIDSTGEANLSLSGRKRLTGLFPPVIVEEVSNSVVLDFVLY